MPGPGIKLKQAGAHQLGQYSRNSPVGEVWRSQVALLFISDHIKVNGEKATGKAHFMGLQPVQLSRAL